MPEWHLVGDLTDPSLNPDDLPAEVAARLSGDAQEAAEREAADNAEAATRAAADDVGSAGAATEVTTRGVADTVLADAIAAEVASRIASSGYTHLQVEPQTIWLIQHNLGFDPAGIVVSSGGFTFDEFSIHYVIPGQTLVLAFDIPLAGAANLS